VTAPRKPRAPRKKKAESADTAADTQTLLEVLVPQAAAPAEKPKRTRTRKKAVESTGEAAASTPEASAATEATQQAALIEEPTREPVATERANQRAEYFQPTPAAPTNEAKEAPTAEPGSASPPASEATAPGNGYNGNGGAAAPANNQALKNNGNGQNDRDDWKRNKRKRNKQGGKWQPGGPKNGGPVHPKQPAPADQSTSVQGGLPDPARFEDLAALDALAAELAELAAGNAASASATSSAASAMATGTAPPSAPLYLNQIYALALAELNAFARGLGLTFEGTLNRAQLLELIFKKAAEAKLPLRDRGYIDINAQGAFIVHTHVNYRLYPEDAWLPESLIKRYGLKRGHQVEVLVQPPQEGERCPAVVRIESVMGSPPEEISKVTPFEELVPYYPLQRILLEAPAVQRDVSMRAVDILTPIGFGQRGLIVAPPRTGKTILLQNIANSVTENFPDYTLILLLIDERPEEVTDFRRHTKGEVVSSTFDEAPESHVHCAEMVGEKARRLVEQGKHVVILLDSITRLARAYNALASNSGKIMSGGMEATALQKPKRFFGAARNIEGAGSLTIIGTALVDTGSRMDEVIFEEFKGTGNMELHLDRGLVERRIFPAINIDRSGTRKEELIYHPEELQKIYGLRRAMQGLGPIESMEMLIKRLKATKSNAEFLLGLR